MKEEKTLINDMTVGPVLPVLLRFAVPLLLANLLQAVYSMVDMMVVGQFVGPSGLSAVGIGGQLQMMFLNIGMGFGAAGQIIISQQIGSGSKNIRATIGTLLTLEALLAVVFGLFGGLAAPLLLGWMNTPAEAMADAISYFTIYCCGMLFVYGYNAVCAILRGMGESKMPMVFIAIASMVNVALDLLFVAVFEMGAAGAALATVIAQAVAFIFSLVYLYKNRSAISFDFKIKSFAMDLPALSALMRLGIPLIVQYVLVTFSMMFVNAKVNAISLTASAVDSVGGKLNTVANIVAGAISVAASTMIAQCFGARKMDRVKKIHWACFAICMGWWLILAAGYLLIPRQIFGLFTSDAEVLDLSRVYCQIGALWLLGFCSMCPPYSVVEGIGYASFNLIVGLLDGVVMRIGLAVVFGHFWGLTGFWLGSALASFTTTILMGIYYFSGRWQHREVVLKE